MPMVAMVATVKSQDHCGLVLRRCSPRLLGEEQEGLIYSIVLLRIQSILFNKKVKYQLSLQEVSKTLLTRLHLQTVE